MNMYPLLLCIIAGIITALLFRFRPPSDREREKNESELKPVLRPYEKRDAKYWEGKSVLANPSNATQREAQQRWYYRQKEGQVPVPKMTPEEKRLRNTAYQQAYRERNKEVIGVGIGGQKVYTYSPKVKRTPEELKSKKADYQRKWLDGLTPEQRAEHNRKMLAAYRARQAIKKGKLPVVSSKGKTNEEYKEEKRAYASAYYAENKKRIAEKARQKRIFQNRSLAGKRIWASRTPEEKAAITEKARLAKVAKNGLAFPLDLAAKMKWAYENNNYSHLTHDQAMMLRKNQHNSAWRQYHGIV